MVEISVPTLNFREKFWHEILENPDILEWKKRINGME